MSEQSNYPNVFDPNKIGTYPALTRSGGGYVWDEVLEYRVWCSPLDGAEALEGGDDYYYAFETYDKAEAFHEKTVGSKPPLALVLQREYLDEPSKGNFVHVRAERMTEWPVQFLKRPRRSDSTIPDFLSPNAPNNRLAILRGEVRSESKP